MATIRKRGKSWQAQIRHTGCPSQTKSFRLKSHAVAWARQVESKLDLGANSLNRSNLKLLTVGDLLKRYRDEVTCHKKSAAQESSAISTLLRNPLVEIQLAKINNQFKYFSKISN
jgi:hypothetical protein